MGFLFVVGGERERGREGKEKKSESSACPRFLLG